MNKIWNIIAAVCAAIVFTPSAAQVTVSPSLSIPISPSASFPTGVTTPVLNSTRVPIATPVLSPTPSPVQALNATCQAFCQGICDPLGNGTCICAPGSMLVGQWTCVACPRGKYGDNCSRNCTCSNLEKGNGCDPVNGTCRCSGCFASANCSVSNGTKCINNYLALDNAAKAAYLNTYGAPPIPPTNQEKDAIIGLIGGVYTTTPVFTAIPRTNARTLLQVQVTLDRLTNSVSGVQNILTKLQNQVKSGQLRTTLVIQDNPALAYATATLNT